MRTWLVAWILILWTGVAQADSGENRKSVSLIHWFAWDERAFHKAQTEDKLILLDLTAVWCHACHVMDETTYSDREIANKVNDSFVPIRVDADQHPDIETRYRAGGWPTTNLLLPTGEILFQTNALSPDEMTELLEEAERLYSQHKQDFREQARVLWKDVQGTSRLSESVRSVHPIMVDQTVAFMKGRYDAENGGFRSAPKFFEPEAVHMALALGFLKKDPQLTHMGLQTLDRQLALLDPVWGGFYRYAEQADWTYPHYEKMLTIQAGNLQNYLEAFQLTGNSSYQITANAIVNYVWDFLTDMANMQFWESQDADLRSANGSTVLSGSNYFVLNREERKKQGVPFVDRRVFTGSNALMAESFLTAAWILDRPELQRVGLRVIRRLADERWHSRKGVLHSLEDTGFAVAGLLSDHVQLGRALLLAYQYSHEEYFVNRAEQLATFTCELLEDQQNGGFFDRSLEGRHLGLLNMPIKPPAENLQAALWYLDLFYLTQKQKYRLVAERTLQSVASGQYPLPVALMGKAVDRWFRGGVHVAVIGKGTDPMTLALLKKASQFYYPGKLVRMFDPDNGSPQWGEISFPYDGKPVAYACTDKLCSPPVTLPLDLETALLEVLPSRAESN